MQLWLMIGHAPRTPHCGTTHCGSITQAYITSVHGAGLHIRMATFSTYGMGGAGAVSLTCCALILFHSQPMLVVVGVCSTMHGVWHQHGMWSRGGVHQCRTP